MTDLNADQALAFHKAITWKPKPRKPKTTCCYSCGSKAGHHSVYDPKTKKTIDDWVFLTPHAVKGIDGRVLGTVNLCGDCLTRGTAMGYVEKGR